MSRRPSTRKDQLSAQARAGLTRMTDRMQTVREVLDPTGFQAARAFAKRFGVSTLDYPTARRAGLDLLPAWCDPRAGLVVDLGANEGTWTAEVLELFPGVEVVAAEPGPEPLEILRSRFAEVPTVTIDPRAVSATTGTATYHRTRASVFASLLPPSTELHELYELPGGPTDLLETFEVDTVTLDELVGDRAVSVMKVDVQGGELGVLEGGAATLERTAAILVEVLFLKHYEGDAPFPVLHQELAKRGFDLFDIGPVFRLDDGPALWADACYCRPPT